MNTSLLHRDRRFISGSVSILSCAALTALTACSSSSSSGGAGPTSGSMSGSMSGSPSGQISASGSTPPPIASQPASSQPAGSTSTAAEVARLSKPVTSYVLPTASIDPKRLAGKTVYYIPISQQAPAFKAVSDAMTEALAKVGMKLQICDGAANPSSVSACVNQAVGASAAGIVMDSIPYGLAASALSSAQSKGVPVLITDQLPDPGHPASTKLGYLPGPATAMLEVAARSIIVGSGGKAVVVINEVNDNPSSVAYVDKAVAVFKNECSGCKITINKISSANFQLVAPSTSSAVLKTPGVDYVLAEYDLFLQPTADGIKQSGKAASIKLVSTAANLSSLQAMSKGQGPAAEVGQSLAFQGWADTDAILRLALGKPAPTYDIPYRLFTADNIHSIQATPAASASGEWFGPADYPAKFTALWKAS